MKSKLLNNLALYASLFLSAASFSQVAPTASFSVNEDTLCAKAPLQVTDLSSDFPTAWSYSVNGVASFSVQNPALSFMAAGVYTIDLEATNINGTSAVFSQTVFVHPLPVITVSGNTLLCSSAAGTLNATGADTYTWDSGSNNSTITINPAASTFYTLVGTSTLTGCSDSTQISVTVNSVSLTASSGSICAGASFTIIPGGAVTYTFSGGSNVVSPQVNTVYTVSGTDAAGCTDSIAVVISVTPSPTITVNTGSICAGTVFTIIPSGASSYTFSSGSNTVAPITNTVYTVTGADPVTGCIGSANVSISVTPQPSITVNSGTVCAGAIYTLMPAGATSYTFSNGSATVMPMSTTNYSITGSNGNCVSLSPAVATVIVAGAIPNVSVSSSAPGIICAGDNIILTAYGASTYSWATGETTSTVVVNPNVTTLFNVIGTDLAGCKNAASLLQYVSQCTGMHSSTLFENLLVYPNPTNGLFVIETGDKMDLKIRNALGQVILTEQLPAGKNALDLSSCPEGVYFINISRNNEMKSFRIIKN